MKEYKFIIPDTSDIEVGDVIEIEGVRHVLTEGLICGKCSLHDMCGFNDSFPCNLISNTAFKIE